MENVTISVRGLVEFLLRSGDLDNRIGGSPEDAMQAGSFLHRKIQQEEGDAYQAEVTLSYVWEYSDSKEPMGVCVSGRADGIFAKGQGDDRLFAVDEIKTTYRRLKSIRKPEPVHLAQARCYAFIYAEQNDLPEIGVRMTYANLQNEERKYFFEVYSREELLLWYTDLMDQYRPWAQHLVSWKKKREESIHSLTFPYPYRPGQKDLAAAVYRTIARNKKLFLEAPTGTGKTLSVLFPAIKAIGEKKADKLFYLTAKTITRTAALSALEELRKQGLRFKSVILSAKEKICTLEKPMCNPDACPRAKGHFDRINEAMYDLLTHEDEFSFALIRRYAASHEVCPFELELDISLWSDAIIGDYNYLFDPTAYLRRFFGEEKGDYIFLIDEAHNLVERGRNMYSAELIREDVLEFKKKVTGLWPELPTILHHIGKELQEIKKEIRPQEEVQTPDPENASLASLKTCVKLTDLSALISAVGEADGKLRSILADEWIAELTGRARADPLREKKKEIWQDFLDFYFNLDFFAVTYAQLDDHYVPYAITLPDSRFMVRLFCVDPSRRLRQCMERGRSSILFSATLLPITYYKALLGGTKEDYEIYAQSVFDPDKRGLFLETDVTSRYKDRSEEGYQKIAMSISQVISSRSGNYMAFFPSYDFMSHVAEYFLAFPAVRKESVQERMPWDALPPPDAAGSITLLLQTSHMSEKEREAFLQKFSCARRDRTLIAFCVLGGIFGEGIDLKRDALIGVMIVGTGIPGAGGERDLLREYFDKSSDNGYEYAYCYPGMNKVLQAAGRVIRTSEDVGIVVLMDERFDSVQYRRLFPREWQNVRQTNVQRIAQDTADFWRQELTKDFGTTRTDSEDREETACGLKKQ